ncbi:MAG: tetratricopeptide repeat protein, partial [Okeania sp. SIO3C4]|nr:tetratricopeptide repeat protein [Okeania sp. SIO3C4]
MKKPFNLKKLLSQLGRSFIQLLRIIFLNLPALLLKLIFPSLRRRLLPENQNDDSSSATAHTKEKLPDKLHPQLDFLIQVLQATAESNGNPKIIYPLLQQNLDKLDDNFAHILQTWATAKLSEVETEEAESIAKTIWYFSYYLNDFPLGKKANNMEIVISGYEAVLKVFTRENNSENWAAIQNNLANAYSDRIRGDRAENIESAIAAYHLALEVRTKQDFPMNWAGTQNNLAIAYRNRIRGDRAENIESAIAAYHLALEVRTKQDFPMNWAMT